MSSTFSYNVNYSIQRKWFLENGKWEKTLTSKAFKNSINFCESIRNLMSIENFSWIDLVKAQMVTNFMEIQNLYYSENLEP